MPSRDLTPACLLRARKDVGNLASCDETEKRDGRIRSVALLARKLERHIEDLRTVLPDIVRNAEMKAAEVQACSQVVLECWRLIGSINTACRGTIAQIPHPLAKEAERIRLHLERSLSVLAHVKHHEDGSAAIDAEIDSIVFGYPDAGAILEECDLTSCINAERFIARLAAEYGEGTEHIDRVTRDALNQIEQQIARHAKRAEAAREREESARRKVAEQPLSRESSSPVQPPAKPDAPASKSDRKPSATKQPDEEMPIEEADWAKRFDVGAGLVIDPAKCSVSLNGKTLSFGKRATARFRLLFILAKHRTRWVPANRLSQPDGPWREKDGVTPSTLNSAMSRLRASLKDLPSLAKALECQSDKLHGNARLMWPPESAGD
jgi:DNA-binding response OmpR family regulator